MSLYGHVFARIDDPFLALGERSGMREFAVRHWPGRTGERLEIGAGTGLNLSLYPPALGALLAEPDAPMVAQLHRRTSAAGHQIEVVQAPAEQLPFADGSFDTVVSTLVLCTVGDLSASLRQIGRVLTPGGQLLFVEHVRAARPVWRAGRTASTSPGDASPTAATAIGTPLLRCATTALRSRRLEQHRWRGMPRIVQPLVVGRATGRARGSAVP